MKFVGPLTSVIARFNCMWFLNRLAHCATVTKCGVNTVEAINQNKMDIEKEMCKKIMYRFSKNFQKAKYLDERKEEASFIGVDSIQVFFCSPQHFLKLQWQFFISTPYLKAFWIYQQFFGCPVISLYNSQGSWKFQLSNQSVAKL